MGRLAAHHEAVIRYVPVNAMHKVYVEIDGKPHAGWDRKFTYRTQ